MRLNKAAAGCDAVPRAGRRSGRHHGTSGGPPRVARHPRSAGLRPNCRIGSARGKRLERLEIVTDRAEAHDVVVVIRHAEYDRSCLSTSRAGFGRDPLYAAVTTRSTEAFAAFIRRSSTPFFSRCEPALESYRCRSAGVRESRSVFGNLAVAENPLRTTRLPRVQNAKAR
jgi:hypothetical protein